MSILSLQKQSQNTDFPNLRPSLDLRFALAKKLDPRITFTRGSTGTYFGPDGLMKTAIANEPRFDHDPITGQSLGLLIEESRQNLLTYSEDFGTGWFNGDGSVSTNLITAPDGNTTADAFIENTLSNKFHYLNQTLTKAASSIQYTGSIWIKDKGRQVLMNLQSGGSNGVVCRFQPATGQMVVSPVAFGTGWTAGSFSVVPYPNGWYRVSMTATSDTLTTVVFQLATYNTAISSNVYTGDGTSGIYIWGAQVEAGTFPTSYIPTSASTVTRSADTANISGTNFSNFFNASEGTLFVDSEIPYQTVNRFPSIGFTRGLGSGNTIQFFYYNTNTPYIQYLVRDTAGGAITTVAISSPNQTVGVYKKFIGTYKVGEYNYYFDGKLVGRSTTNKNLPSNLSMLEIGTNSPSGPDRLNGHIRRITYYPIQLTNQQLINLTS